MFTIRRMTPADKPAMLEISSRIWEGTDYLPGVFDEWVRDQDGMFAAVLLGGRLVGCGKLTYLTPRDAWLEGLRKDPGVAEKGMAEEVARHFLGLLAGRRPRLDSVRFSTYVGNLASRRVNEKIGFKLRTTLSLKAWDGSREALAAVPLASEGRAQGEIRAIRDERLVHELLRRTGSIDESEGLLVEGWRTYPWSDALLLKRYVAEGFCRGVVTDAGLSALSIATVADLPSRTMVRLVRLDALDDQGAALMFDDLFLQAREAIARTGAEKLEIEWMIPRIPRLHRWAGMRGFRSWEQEDDFLVYELPIALLQAHGAPQSAPAEQP